MKMNLTPRIVTKNVIGWIAQYGTGIILYHVIKNNVEDVERIDRKIGVGVASIAIGGAAKDAVRSITDAQIDGFFDTFQVVKDVTQDQK